MKTIGIGFLLLLMLGLTGCKTYHLSSSWTAQRPRIDGQLNEWDRTSLRSLNEGAIQVMLTNDSRYLYLAGIITDPSMARFLRMFGLTLWVDTDGGNSKRVEVRLPAVSAAAFDIDRGGFRESYTEEQRNRAGEQLDSLRQGVLVQSNTDQQYRVFPRGTGEFRAVVTREQETEVRYEMRIPLSFQSDFLSYPSPGRHGTLGLGFGIPMVRRLEEGSMQPGGMMPRRGSFMETEEVWSEVTLAQR